MKTKLIVLFLVLAGISIEAKPKKKQILQTFTPVTVYVNKGFEATYTADNEITITGPDINSTIKLTSNPELPIWYLEQDAILVVDGLAGH